MLQIFTNTHRKQHRLTRLRWRWRPPVAYLLIKKILLNTDLAQIIEPANIRFVSFY